MSSKPEITEENEADSFLNYDSGNRVEGEVFVIPGTYPPETKGHRIVVGKIAKVTIRVVENFLDIKLEDFDFEKCPYPAMLENNPAIIWLKDKKVVWYAIFPTYEKACDAISDICQRALDEPTGLMAGGFGVIGVMGGSFGFGNAETFIYEFEMAYLLNLE